ncbi:MAG: 50S ribosomal protein L29 [Candidatus Limnocylindrus sp.]|jgi:large subunit ribosomal protein L29|nr:50S ribosomal protein L29 [Chloroflexota bacterium]NBP83165.1 50S ribosomal protein L29 [bacterium]NBW31927.1 50S ribosomal protein L29 [Candidatus Aquidulcis frankliniae]NDH28135.1 50S ribosomal protein L29 [Candidatus Aquidulcis sp.]MBJ7360347.1 50S ribosomal protein L29 [Chloroflexota bacterium]
MIEIAQVRNMTDAELVQAIADAKRDLWQARFELSTRQLKDTSVVNKTRKTIARLLMVLAERQAAQKA